MAKRPDVPNGAVWLWTGNTLLYFDGHDVVINRVVGSRKGTFTYPIDQISGVQLTKPRLLKLGVFRVVVPGEVAPRGRNNAGAFVESTNDPFAVQIPMAALPKAEAIAAAIRGAQAELRQPQAGAAPHPGLGDQLAKLAELHAAGALSAAEFAAAKARLLGAPQDAPPS